MSKKILNTIIVFSSLGILIIVVKNYAFSKNASHVSQPFVIPTPSPDQKPLSPDPEVPCTNRYFTFQKGTKWRYKFTAITETKEGKKMERDFLTTKIITASPSSIMIESRYDSQKNNPITTKLVCKKSGIYGMPFPLFRGMDFGSLMTLISILPPDRPLKKNDTWVFPLTLGEMDLVPMTIAAAVRSTVSDQNAQHIRIVSDVLISPTDSGFAGSDLVGAREAMSAFNDLTDELLVYSVEERKGIADLTIDIHLDGVGRYKTSLELVDFTPAF